MMKRGMVNKQGESMVASYRYLGVKVPGGIGTWGLTNDREHIV